MMKINIFTDYIKEDISIDLNHRSYLDPICVCVCMYVNNEKNFFF